MSDPDDKEKNFFLVELYRTAVKKIQSQMLEKGIQRKHLGQDLHLSPSDMSQAFSERSLQITAKIHLHVMPKSDKPGTAVRQFKLTGEYFRTLLYYDDGRLAKVIDQRKEQIPKGFKLLN